MKKEVDELRWIWRILHVKCAAEGAYEQAMRASRRLQSESSQTTLIYIMWF
jgi:hypothetical protein